MSERVLSPRELAHAANREINAGGMTEAEILAAREEEIQEGLREFAGRRLRTYEPSTTYTPLSALVQSELKYGDDDFTAAAAEEAEIRRDAIRHFFEYVAQDGVHPVDVLRNLYAVGAHMGIAPFCELTLRQKKKLFGDSHESHRWLLKKLCVNPLQRLGARSIRAPGQKGRDAQEAAARAQQGNNNRRGGKHARGGKKTEARGQKPEAA